VLAGAPQAALWGPSPVARASARCLDVVRVLRITRGAPGVEAVALRCQAVLEALRDRPDAARRMIAASRRMVEELGLTHRLLEAEVSAGLIELLEDDPAAAERSLRVAYDGLRAHGVAIDAAQAAALLGRALLALGRDAEAEALSHESEVLAGDDLKAAIAWRGVRADALARRGERAAAVDLARAAVEIAAATDALLDHADARVALAVALRAAGRDGEAEVEERRAIELWVAKGATLLAEREAAASGPAADVQPPALFTKPAGDWRREAIATRGERLALFRVPAGESAGEHLALIEHAAGRRVALVTFDVTDLDAALAELDRRFAAGEGAPHAAFLAHHGEFRRAAAARDRDALLRLLPEDFTLLSHRRLANIGRRMSREEYVASLTVMDELGVSAAIRVDHILRICATAVVGVSTYRGTADGSDFENPTVFVGSHDGRVLRGWEQFDLEQLDAALVRYAELAAECPARGFENAATRAGVRLAAEPSDAVRITDRRREQAPASSSVPRRDTLATRGDRLALTRVRPARGEGPSWLELVEADAGGEATTLTLFDDDDVDAAFAELDARYDRGEAAPYGHGAMTRAFRSALAARDWDALSTVLAPDLVVRDHRLLGWDTLHGPQAYLEAVRSLVELAPDVRLRVDHVLEMCQRGVIYAPSWVGTRDGGAFEDPSMIVAEIDASHRIRRFDQYGVDQLDEARARFTAIASGGAPD